MVQSWSVKTDNTTLTCAGWLHFWETKSPEFSLSFQGYFKLFHWATQKRKIRWVHFCWRSCHIFFIFHEFSGFFLQKFKFPWVFPEILTIFQIPWVFQVFHVFQVCGHPVVTLTGVYIVYACFILIFYQGPHAKPVSKFPDFLLTISCQKLNFPDQKRTQ